MGYDAFISYSHQADLELAPVVRDGLQRLAKPWNKRRALSVFLDQASLELSSELGGSLDERIEDTRWLVLFMSVESAQSRWVGEEISEWAEKKSKDQLALVLTSGEVVWDDAAKDFDYERSTAVSEGMRGVYTGQESEPLFLDLRWTKELPDGEKSLDLAHVKFRDAIATLAAPIHGMPKDELEGEDVRQFRLARRLRRAAVTGLAVLTVTAVVAGVVAMIQRAEAIRQRDASEARRLAVVSEAHAAEQTDLALLLALESLATTDTEEGWGALFTALSRPVLARSPLTGHEAGVNRLRFSPDGSVLASMGGDGVVGLWDAAAGGQVGKLEGHEGDGRIWEGAFSPDGSVLATPGSDWTVRLWDVEKRRPLGEPLEGHGGLVWDAAFSPTGEFLATASSDSTVRVWDVGRREHTVVETMGTEDEGIEVWEVAFSEDGSRLAWVSMDGSVRSRRLAAGSTAEVLLAGRDEWSRGSTAPGVAFSHDGTKLAVGASEILEGLGSGERALATVQLWDLAPQGSTLRSLVGHDGFVVDLAFSFDDKTLVSASQDRTVRLWDVATGEPLGNALTGHDGEVFSVGFSPDGKLLASGSADRSVRLWDLGAGGSVGRRLHHGGWVRDVAVSPDGALAASAGMDSKISIWEVASGRSRYEIPGSHDGKWVNSVAFSPDQRFLASTGTDGKVRLWSVDTGLPAGAPLEAHGRRARDARFGPNGRWLASAGDDGKVWLWDREAGQLTGAPLEVRDDQGEPVERAGRPVPVWRIAFSADGQMLASASADNEVRLWEVGTGSHSGDPLTGHEAAVLDLSFDPGGTHLWSASGDGVVLRWDLVTRQAARVLDAGSEWTAAAFSDDGSLLAAASLDGSVRRWDLERGAPAGEALLGHSMRVEALDFSGDGALVVSGSEDQAVRLWPARSRWRELACEAVGRNLSAAEWTEYVDAGRPYRRQCGQHGPADAPGPDVGP